MVASFRRAEIFIQGRTKRRLRWLGQVFGKQEDELADQFINEVIEERWPQILPAEAELRKAEEQFAMSFKEQQEQP